MLRLGALQVKTYFESEFSLIVEIRLRLLLKSEPCDILPSEGCIIMTHRRFDSAPLVHAIINYNRGVAQW